MTDRHTVRLAWMLVLALAATPGCKQDAKPSDEAAAEGARKARKRGAARAGDDDEGVPAKKKKGRAHADRAAEPDDEELDDEAPRKAGKARGRRAEDEGRPAKEAKAEVTAPAPSAPVKEPEAKAPVTAPAPSAPVKEPVAKGDAADEKAVAPVAPKEPEAKAVAGSEPTPAVAPVARAVAPDPSPRAGAAPGAVSGRVGGPVGAKAEPGEAPAPRAPAGASDGRPRAGVFRHYAVTLAGPIGAGELADQGGVAYVRIEDAGGGLWKVARFDGGGVPLGSEAIRVDAQGRIATWRSDDRFGLKLASSTYRCSSDSECLRTQRYRDGRNALEPCAAERIVRDDVKLVEDATCLGRDGQPIPGARGVVTTRVEEYDGPGLRRLNRRVAFFDAAGAPMVSRDGIHAMQTTRNERGCVVETASFGVGGAPAALRGIHRRVSTVGGAGCDVTQIQLMGTDGSRVADEYGVHRYDYAVSRGRVTREARFDTEARRAVSSADKAHVVRYTYDGRGNHLSSAWFGVDDQPVNNLSGYHRMAWTYTANDMMETREFFDAAGKPVSDTFKVHRYYYVRDPRGLVVMQAYYDKRNKPCKDFVDQVYMIKYGHDARGVTTSVSYWRNEAKPMKRWSGVHEFRYVIGEDGRMMEKTSLGTSGELAKGSLGFSREAFQYDALGRWTERSYWHNGTPVAIGRRACVSGYHKVKRVYDARDRVEELRFLGPDGYEVNASFCTVKARASRITFVYRGATVLEQRVFKAGSSVPSKALDCVDKPCVNDWGNQVRKIN